MRTRILLISLATITSTLALAACGGTVPASEAPAAQPPTTAPPAEPPPTTEVANTYDYPTDADAVVIDLVSGGGFVPVELAIDSRPEFRLYGDGTVLARPPDETFPSPPTLLRYTLTPEGIQQVLAAADDAGLLEQAPDYGQPAVTDLPTTTLTVGTDGEPISHSAYALGFEDATGLTAAQTAARQRFADYANLLRTLPTSMPAALAEQPAPFEPDAADVYLFEREAEPGLSAPKWPYEVPPTEWPPVPGDSAFGGACRTVTGPELAAFLDPGNAGTSLYRYGKTPDGSPRFWSIGIDLVLPGETGCDAAA